MELNALVRGDVSAANARRAGVVVVQFPSGERAVRTSRAADLDHARGSGICPSELFLAGPYDFDRLARCFRDARGFDRSLTGVLAAVARPRIRHDDADLLFG